MSQESTDSVDNRSVSNTETTGNDKITRDIVEEKNTDTNKQEGKKDKRKRRRRRNYDDYDAEVDKEEREFKKLKNNDLPAGLVSTTSNVDLDQISDSDIDDEKLDQLLDKELENDVEDDLAEIDASNIIPGGRRTRGKIIDYKKAVKELDSAKTNSNLKAANATNKEIEVDDDDDDDDDDDADFKI